MELQKENEEKAAKRTANKERRAANRVAHKYGNKPAWWKAMHLPGSKK